MYHLRSTMVATTVAVLTSTATASAITIDHGHADYAPRVVDGRLVTQIKNSDGRRRDPADVVIRLDRRARTTLPGRLPVLGRPGRPVWTSPQSRRTGVVWLGWSTDALRDRVRGPVRWTLVAARGPGRFALFQTDAFGRHEVLFASSRRRPGTHKLPVGTHAHGTWAFTRPGRWRLTFRWEGRSSLGRRLSHTSVLRFRVG